MAQQQQNPSNMPFIDLLGPVNSVCYKKKMRLIHLRYYLLYIALCTMYVIIYIILFYSSMLSSLTFEYTECWMNMGSSLLPRSLPAY